jgi:regulatory protein
MRLNSNPSEQELLHKAAAYCSTSEHCIGEVLDKLASWGASAEEKNRILKRLVQENFIDESRYAKAFVKDKYRFNRWGKIKIKMALMQKKVEPELIDEALALIEEEEYQENLIEILLSKRKTLRDRDYQTLKAKLFRFGASRGFESNIILQTISRILQHDTDDME